MSVIEILNQGWIGALIGLVGVIFAIYQIVRRLGAKPSYQYDGQLLISNGRGLLPNEVSVLFNGAAVPRISMTYIVFWNDGQSTIRGSDILDTSPVTFSFKDAQILKAEIIRVTRDVIEATAKTVRDGDDGVVVNFRFLDARDGFVIKILHTSEKTVPYFCGTIMGVPEGVRCRGRIDRVFPRKSVRFNRNAAYVRRVAVVVFAALGVLMLGSSLFPRLFELETSPEGSPFNQPLVGQVIIGFVGVTYLLTSFLFWRKGRRRFPSALTYQEN